MQCRCSPDRVSPDGVMLIITSVLYSTYSLRGMILRLAYWHTQSKVLLAIPKFHKSPVKYCSVSQKVRPMY